MMIEELKDTIRRIVKEDPDFFAELVGEIVKENLHICEQQRDYYASRDSWVNPELRWGPTTGESDTFSYAR